MSNTYFFVVTFIAILAMSAFVVLLIGVILKNTTKKAIAIPVITILITVSVIGSLCGASKTVPGFWAEKLNWEPKVSARVITVEKLDTSKGKAYMTYTLAGHDQFGEPVIRSIGEFLYSDLNVGDVLIERTTVRSGKVLFLNLYDENAELVVS